MDIQQHNDDTRRAMTAQLKGLKITDFDFLEDVGGFLIELENGRCLIMAESKGLMMSVILPNRAAVDFGKSQMNAAMEQAQNEITEKLKKEVVETLDKLLFSLIPTKDEIQ